MISIPRGYRRIGRAAFAVAAFALACATGAFVAGCGSHQAADASDSGVSNDTIALVNGDPITSAEHYEALQHFIPARITGFPQNPILAVPAGRTALQNLIENKLTLQLAKSNGVSVQQDEVDAFYNDNKMLQEAQQTQSFEASLAAQGYTPDEYKQEVLAPQVAQLNLLAKSVTVTPEELQAAYTGNTGQYTVPAQVHIRRIVTATKQDAETVYDDLKNGQPMSSLTHFNIAADGAGGNPDDSTDVAQWINVERPSPQLGTAGILLKTAKSGDILAPTQVQGIWWVIQVVESRRNRVLPFSDVQDLVRINVIRQKAGQTALLQFQNSLMAAMEQASIIIYPPQYQSLAADLHNAAMTAAVPPGAPAAPAPVTIPNAPK
jgi:parvulin-like peptidyl-prolyl isomerase